MLSGKILNSNASLNDFKEVRGVDFSINDSFSLVFRIIDPELEDRFVPPDTAIVTITFNNFDGTTFTKSGPVSGIGSIAIDPGDKSMIKVSLAPSDTSQMFGGNLTYTIDLLGDQTEILYGILYNALNKIPVSWGPNG